MWYKHTNTVAVVLPGTVIVFAHHSFFLFCHSTQGPIPGPYFEPDGISMSRGGRSFWVISSVPIASRSTLDSFLLIRIGLLAKPMQTSSMNTTLLGCSGMLKRQLLQRMQGVPHIENARPSPYLCLLEAHLTRSIHKTRDITVHLLASIQKSTTRLGWLPTLPVFAYRLTAAVSAIWFSSRTGRMNRRTPVTKEVHIFFR